MDRETALRELRGNNPDLQRLAARMLGRWPDEGVQGALIECLQSPHRGIREAVIDTLVEVGDAHTMRQLIPLLRNGVPAVRNAARALLQTLAKAAPELLGDLSCDPDPRMRIFAANILGESGDHDSTGPLLDLLDDPDENVRDAAVVGLGRLGAPEAVRRLEVLAGAGTDWSRFSAIDALGQIRSVEAVQSLLRLLPSSPPALREPVIESLRRQGSVESIGPLLAILGEPLQGGVLDFLLAFPPSDVVGRLGPGERDSLARALSDKIRGTPPSGDSLAASLTLLSWLGIEVDPDLLVRPLSSSNRVVRRAAIRAAVRLGLRQTLPLLQGLSRAGDPCLAEELKSAIAALGGPGKEKP